MMKYKINKPIGARLPNCELPGGSFVNVEVVSGPGGIPDLLLTNPTGGPITLFADDVRAIYLWATAVDPAPEPPYKIVRATLGARVDDPPVAVRSTLEARIGDPPVAIRGPC